MTARRSLTTLTTNSPVALMLLKESWFSPCRLPGPIAIVGGAVEKGAGGERREVALAVRGDHRNARNRPAAR